VTACRRKVRKLADHNLERLRIDRTSIATVPRRRRSWIRLSTTNFQTFADLSFRFILTPEIVVETLAFSLAMGFIGGFLPAMRAARMSIVDALRAR
jgi:ABC-type antimicrobial peptide transport system permease subunit